MKTIILIVCLITSACAKSQQPIGIDCSPTGLFIDTTHLNPVLDSSLELKYKTLFDSTYNEIYQSLDTSELTFHSYKDNMIYINYGIYHRALVLYRRGVLIELCSSGGDYCIGYIRRVISQSRDSVVTVLTTNRCKFDSAGAPTGEHESIVERIVNYW